jgi:hypothetical protein
LKWVAPAGGAKSFSLLNTGGTALTGASTITVSSISSIDDLIIVVVGASAANGTSSISIQFNSDSGSNYRWAGPAIYGGGGFDSNNFTSINGSFTTSINFGRTDSNAAGTLNGHLRLSGGNSSGVKAFTSASGGANDAGNGQRSSFLGGIWNNSATISSVSILSNNGNFDAGTIFVYGAA